MKNLKLNQLNKQKVAESEMNVIKGGALPFLPAEFEKHAIDPGICGDRCAGNEVTMQGFVNGLKVFM